MGMVHTIYLGMLSNRVPVLPPFVPTHVGPTNEFYVGDLFDLPRLRKGIRHPVIEWRDVKDTARVDQRETLNCWSARQSWDHEEPGSVYSWWLSLGQ